MWGGWVGAREGTFWMGEMVPYKSVFVYQYPTKESIKKKAGEQWWYPTNLTHKGAWVQMVLQHKEDLFVQSHSAVAFAVQL